MLDIKDKFLTLVRQDSKLLWQLTMIENLYGRENQTQFLKKAHDSDIVLEFKDDGKIQIVRYRESEPMGSVDVDSIDAAYKQVRYFANHGKLRDEDML